jgi:hypothetical protein
MDWECKAGLEARILPHSWFVAEVLCWLAGGPMKKVFVAPAMQPEARLGELTLGITSQFFD